MKQGDLHAIARGRYDDLFNRYRECTMVDRVEFIDNLLLVDEVLKNPSLAKGSIIECGTWRGGMAAALVELGGETRKYHFFDSFQGLPPAQEIDGEAALAWQRNLEGPRYFNNCRASREEFERTLSLSAPHPGTVHIHEGWFRDTLWRANVGAISILRLDADWYDSTMACLDRFWGDLLPGALILIDDYACWTGCRRAIHAFFARQNASEYLRVTFPGKVTYFLKD